MSWNYRVVKKAELLPSGEVEYGFSIYEVYYEKEGGRINAISHDPAHIYGESVEELSECIKLISNALAKPVLDYEKLILSFREKGPS